MFKLDRSFTLLEIMIVIILISIVAAFGIPRYNQSVDRADEREAVHNLRIIGDALEQYDFRQGGYPAFNMAEISDINNALDLGIIEQNMDYDCVENAGDMTCNATSPDGWDINHDTSRAINNNPQCGVANCPSNNVGDSYYGMF